MLDVSDPSNLLFCSTSPARYEHMLAEKFFWPIGRRGIFFFLYPPLFMHIRSSLGFFFFYNLFFFLLFFCDRAEFGLVGYIHTFFNIYS